MCFSVAFVGSCPQGCPCRWVAPFGACMGSLVAPLLFVVFSSCLVRCCFDVWFVWVSGLSFWVLHSLFFCFLLRLLGAPWLAGLFPSLSHVVILFLLCSLCRFCLLHSYSPLGVPGGPSCVPTGSLGGRSVHTQWTRSALWTVPVHMHGKMWPRSWASCGTVHCLPCPWASSSPACLEASMGAHVAGCLPFSRSVSVLSSSLSQGHAFFVLSEGHMYFVLFGLPLHNNYQHPLRGVNLYFGSGPLATMLCACFSVGLFTTCSADLRLGAVETPPDCRPEA